MSATRVEGPAVEEVLFLRDEAANLGWAVERVVEDRAGDPRLRVAERHNEPVKAPDRVPGAELDYLLQTSVPEWWIPYVPQVAGAVDVLRLELARRAMMRFGPGLPDDGDPIRPRPPTERQRPAPHLRCRAASGRCSRATDSDAVSTVRRPLRPVDRAPVSVESRRGAQRPGRSTRRYHVPRLGDAPPWQDGEHARAPLLLLDGASMWFRSYFGVPSSITAPDGRPVNAVRGFLDAVATLITRERPARLVVCRDDDWRPQWRVDLIPSYKAHRVEEVQAEGPDIEEVPDELTPQVDMIMEILDAFGIPTAGAPDCEADDVLGTLAARERKDPVVVVSGDRDLLQLVRDDPVSVRVLYLGRGLAKATKYGPAEVAETYGVPVDRAGPAYAELALLRGDPSDGLPGVPGCRREDGGHTAGTARLAGGHPGRRPRPEIEDVQGIPDEAACRDRLHRGGRAGGQGGHRRRRQLLDEVGRAAVGRRAPAQGGQARRAIWRDVVDRAAAEGA